MTDVQAIAILSQAKSGRRDYAAFDKGIEAIGKLNRIQAITERALRSSDPINLYKACCINEIAEVLGVRVDNPAPEADKQGQISIDDII